MAFPRGLTAAGALVLLAAGCSSSSGPLTRSGPSATTPAATSTAPATVPATQPTATATGAATQQVVITPATGLKPVQTVLVQASGFAPGESLVVTQCAAKGTATGPGDCDLTSMQSVTADTAGRVKVRFTVRKGPFGANNIVCGAAQACLVSVTQATLSPTREADAPVSFG